MLRALLLAVSLAALAAPAGAQPALPQILTDPPPGVYLPDFSTVGYRWGETAPPRGVAGATVVRPESFGAVPDDGLDDTEAVLAALAQAHRQRGPVVVELPQGRLDVRAVLYVERDSLVIRGAGASRSELHFPLPLRDLEQNAVLDSLRRYAVEFDKQETLPDGTRAYYSPYSWTGGVVWTRLPEGRGGAEVVGPVRDGRRGGHDVTVEGDVAAGDVLRLQWFNREGMRSSLLRAIYGYDPDSTATELWTTPERPLVWQDVTVVAVGPGGRVRVKEPLLHDLRPAWGTRAVRVPALTEVGFEDFAVTFPNEPHGGHHLEAGYNGFFFNDLRHSWVRGVRVAHADAAILHESCSQGTVQDVVVEGRGGHYGLHFGSVYGMLATGVTVAARSVHALSFNTASTGSVVHRSLAVRGPIDQHRGANHQNLFDAVTLVLTPDGVAQAFKSAGAPQAGPRHGAHSTLWNVAVAVAGDVPPVEALRVLGVADSSRANLVGFHAYLATYTGYGAEGAALPAEIVYAGYRESVGEAVAVPSLYAYQLRRRLGVAATGDELGADARDQP